MVLKNKFKILLLPIRFIGTSLLGVSLGESISKLLSIQNILQPYNKQRYMTSFLLFLDSERSEECIDFTMIVYSITSRNNAPISNYGGGFRCKSEYPWCIIEVKS
ncbi:Uncharacterized protein FWK35_00029222 [Aphis craccivora]|uniref:Uncharacterized protein n=1 Tax=Aphis craccivora TaxID=307492 RepID=A0A6G0VPI6_APHCR|nr:Uncharacterized protein FWK35_00029222 [Aphis craccivora]